MSLRIKSEAVHQLAKQVAKATNTSMTAAIETALREKLDDLERQRTPKAGLTGVSSEERITDRAES